MGYQFINRNYRYLITIFWLLFISCESNSIDNQEDKKRGTLILSYGLESGQIGESAISNDESSVVVNVVKGTPLDQLVPSIKVSEGASVVPASGEKISVGTDLNFKHKVIAENGDTREWNVKFILADTSKPLTIDYATYKISNTESVDHNLQVKGNIEWNEKYWSGARYETAPNSQDKWQKWHIKLHSSVDGLPYYRIRNLFSGHYISLPDVESSLVGEEVVQDYHIHETDASVDRQLWRIEKSGDLYLFRTTENLILTLAQTDEEEDRLLLSDVIQEGSYWNLTAVANESYRDSKVENFFRRNDPEMGSVAFDQGNSIPLSHGDNNGKVLWITEDAFDGFSIVAEDGLNCGHFFSYNNSMYIQEDENDWRPQNTYNLINTNRDPNNPLFHSLPDVPGTDWVWPGAGIAIEDKVYVYAGEGQGLGRISQAIYVANQSNSELWTWNRTTPKNMGGVNGFINGGDGYVYAYEGQSRDFGYNHWVIVRRFQETDPMADWEVWNGTQWTTDEIDLSNASVAEAASVGEYFATASHMKLDNGTYLMVTMSLGFFCDDNRSIYLSYANSPNGPYSTPVKVHDIVDYFHGEYTRYYTPILHPFATDYVNGEVLMTFSVNFTECGDFGLPEGQGRLTTCEEDGYFNAYYYRNKAVRIPLSLIGL
jgi:hypothetical protein